MVIDRPKLHRFYRYMIDWLYPNVCPCCGKYIDHDADFCNDCKNNITPYTGDSVPHGLDGFAAYCEYDHNIDDAILHFKKDPDGNSYYAFACGIAEALRKNGIIPDIDMIVPIPITKAKMKSRGYNQTELIARELRFLIDKPYENLLMKIRDTKDQKNMLGKDRSENVKDVFAVDPRVSDLTGKRLLVIDDVCTTGSTLSEAAKVLKTGGAAKVYAAAFAKTPFRKRGQ